jgi:hypothetical protein
LNDLLLDRLIEIPTANSSKLHFGQEVFHGDLQRLYYDLSDMHTLTLKIKEDIEFQIGIKIKLKLGKKIVWKPSRLVLFGPLKQILFDLHNICRFAHL